MNNFRDSLIKYGTYFLVLFAPLVFISHRLYPHISTKTFFIYGVVEILFFVWIYSLIVDKSYRLSKRVWIYFLPLIGFVLWMSISGMFAFNPHLSFWSSFARGTGLLTLYHCLALSFIVASLVNKNGSAYIYSLFQWFITGAFILACSVWMGTDGFQSTLEVLRTDAGGGFAGNSTLTAGYLLFALAMASFLLFTKKVSQGRKWLVVIAILTIIFSPVFASLYGFFNGNSILGTARGTILALITGTGMSFVGYMLLSSKKVVRGVSIGIVVIGLATFAFLWNQLVTPNTSLHNKFGQEARESRFIFWNIATKAMNDRPILGYGVDNYAIAYQTYFNPNILVESNSFEGWNDRAHNIFYELGATAGYPALAFYVVLICSLFSALYRSYKQERLTRAQVSVFAGLLVAYVVNNLFTFDSNLSWMSLFLISGIVYSVSQKETSDLSGKIHKIKNSNNDLIAVGLALLFVTSWIFFVRMPSMKSKAYSEIFASKIDKRADLYPKLLKGSSMGSDWDMSSLAFESYRKYASNAFILKNDKEKLPYVINDLEKLLAHLYKVSEKNKTDYRLYITTSFLESTLTYMSGRNYEKITQDRILGVLDHAKKLSPTNPNVYWSIAQVKVWGGDFAGTEEAYRQSIEVAPSLASPYRLLLNYAQALGDQKLFNETMIQAKENVPGFEFK